MVAKQVKVYSRSAKPNAKGYCWTSDGYRNFSCDEFSKLFSLIIGLGNTLLPKLKGLLVAPRSSSNCAITHKNSARKRMLKVMFPRHPDLGLFLFDINLCICSCRYHPEVFQFCGLSDSSEWRTRQHGQTFVDAAKGHDHWRRPQGFLPIPLEELWWTVVSSPFYIWQSSLHPLALLYPWATYREVRNGEDGARCLFVFSEGADSR